ncbi:MAG: SH3 domain-containing protein [Pyrinomonadaceae bacterium]
MKIKSQWLHLIGICLLLLINFTSVSAQTDWFFVALTSSGNTVFIDKNFTRSSNGIIKVWQKTVSLDETYIIALGEWNCARKSFRYIQSVIYDNNGIASDRSRKPSEWRLAIPDSTGMLLYLNICEDNQNINSDKQKIEKPNSSFAQIIVRKANLMREADSNSKVIHKVSLGEKLVLIDEKSIGGWYRVLDPKTNSQGWLNGNNFKIVKAKSSSKKVKSRRKK